MPRKRQLSVSGSFWKDLGKVSGGNLRWSKMSLEWFGGLVAKKTIIKRFGVVLERFSRGTLSGFGIVLEWFKRFGVVLKRF